MERMTSEEFKKKVAAGNKWRLKSQQAATKYHNKRASVGTEKFDSQLESDDYLLLLQYRKEKLLRNIERQVRFKLYAWEYHISDALVDFRFEMPDGTIVWYESKGFVTDVFVMKKRLIVANLKVGELYIINRVELDNYLQCYTRNKPYKQLQY